MYYELNTHNLSTIFLPTIIPSKQQSYKWFEQDRMLNLESKMICGRGWGG